MELNIDRLSKQYDNKIAVDRISFCLKEGVYGLLGENGAGKTTLIRMLCGVLKPTGGSVSYNGIDVSKEEYRDALGYLPQQFGYYPEFTVFDFMLYMGSLKGLSRKQAREKTMELLEIVSLNKVSKRKIGTLSGGMKQRLGIAQAMLNNPKILILDEPTAGLDPKERIRFRNLISQLGKNRIVLLSTHIVSDIENIATTILLMKGGQFIHIGSLKDILSVIENKVYECLVEPEKGEELMQKYPTINIRQEDDKTYLRLVTGEKPYETAMLVQPTLEDLYLYCFSEVKEYE